MSFRPGSLDKLDRDRLFAGVDATLQNVGPERPPLWDPDELDAYAGTTSGARIRGKPSRGSGPRRGY